MPEMRIADFLRHDVQAYGVPGAPEIDRILQACDEAANWIDKLESRLAQVERERDAAVNELKKYQWYEGENVFPKGMTQAEYFGYVREDSK